MKEHPLKLSQNMKNPMVEEEKVSKMDEASRHRRQSFVDGVEPWSGA